MTRSRRATLQRAGFAVGTTAHFLQLEADEATYVELELALATEVRRARAAGRITQRALARKLGSSQALVASVEAGDPAVSLDMLVRALLAPGMSPRALGRVVGSARGQRAA